MKNTLLTLVVVLLSGTAMLSAQETGYYFRGGLGAAVPYAGQTVDFWEREYNGSSTGQQGNSNYSYHLDKSSFSTGLRGYLAAGYMINKNVGFELGADIGLVSSNYEYTGTNISATAYANGTPEDFDAKQQAHVPFVLSPSLVLQTGDDLWKLYVRVGMALPLSHSIDVTETHTYGGKWPDSVYVFNHVLKTRFELGFTSALGVSRSLSDHLKLWGEVSVLSLTLYADEIDIKDATLNGVSFYNNINHVILFRTSGSGSDRMSYAVPFSNVSFNAGLSWILNKRNKAASKKN